MNNSVIHRLSYGLYILGSHSRSLIDCCIMNTCMEVAIKPLRIAISVLNSNLTCQLIKESGYFSLSILDKRASYETIERFGFKTGREENKLENVPYKVDKNGSPYIETECCGVIVCNVISCQYLLTHTLFIAEIEDAFEISSFRPLLCSEYYEHLRPETKRKKQGIIGWRCRICGYEYTERDVLPNNYRCPDCNHGEKDFEPIYHNLY